MTVPNEPVPISVLTEKYIKEFQDVRQYFYDASIGFKSTIAQSKDTLKEIETNTEKRMKLGIITPLKNFAPISLEDTELLQYFSWFTIMQFVHYVAYNFAAPLLWPFLTLLVTHIQALLLIIFIPMFTYQNIEISADMRSRYQLLAFSAAHGLAMGYLFENYYLALPLPFIVPLMIAFCANLLSKTSDKSSRLQFLTVSLIEGLLLNFLIGYFLDELQFSYVAVSVLYSICALVTVQYYIDHSENDYVKNPYFYMLVLFCFNIIVQALFLLLCAY